MQIVYVCPICGNDLQCVALTSDPPQIRYECLCGWSYSRCGVLWSRGYFVSTVGHISEATVKRYIEEQKTHD